MLFISVQVLLPLDSTNIPDLLNIQALGMFLKYAQNN